MFRSRSRLRMSAKTLRTLYASLTEGVVRRSRRVAVSPVFFPCVPLCPPWFGLFSLDSKCWVRIANDYVGVRSL